MKFKRDWGPGYRFFECPECGHKWADISRDFSSPSGDPCPKMDQSDHTFGIGNYLGGEPHFEWPTDPWGNLLDDHEYPEWKPNE